jgi:hypothetical protein
VRHLERVQLYKEKKIEAGICVRCQEPARPGRHTCLKHANLRGTYYKLSPEDVERIRIAKKDGRTGRDLAAEFGISRWHLYRITRGDVRRDCPGPLTRRGEP